MPLQTSDRAFNGLAFTTRTNSSTLASEPTNIVSTPRVPACYRSPDCRPKCSGRRQRMRTTRMRQLLPGDALHVRTGPPPKPTRLHELTSRRMPQPRARSDLRGPVRETSAAEFACAEMRRAPQQACAKYAAPRAPKPMRPRQVCGAEAETMRAIPRPITQAKGTCEDTCTTSR